MLTLPYKATYDIAAAVPLTQVAWRAIFVGISSDASSDAGTSGSENSVELRETYLHGCYPTPTVASVNLGNFCVEF